MTDLIVLYSWVDTTLSLKRKRGDTMDALKYWVFTPGKSSFKPRRCWV